jgi:hypothetical protein
VLEIVMLIFVLTEDDHYAHPGRLRELALRIPPLND